jgi:large subunit ribosomal protein L18e
MTKTSKTNAHLQRVVRELRDLARENEVAIWRDVAERLERARRNWSEVNLSRVNRYAEKGQKVVVPGVLLATGELTFPVTVAAFRTSDAARKKVEAVGGHALNLIEFATQNPKGSGVRLLG